MKTDEIEIGLGRPPTKNPELGCTQVSMVLLVVRIIGQHLGPYAQVTNTCNIPFERKSQLDPILSGNFISIISTFAYVTFRCHSIEEVNESPNL